MKAKIAVNLTTSNISQIVHLIPELRRTAERMAIKAQLGTEDTQQAIRDLYGLVVKNLPFTTVASDRDVVRTGPEFCFAYIEWFVKEEHWGKHCFSHLKSLPVVCRPLVLRRTLVRSAHYPRCLQPNMRILPFDSAPERETPTWFDTSKWAS
ncbi:uncharacterized protein CTRU02_215811 [Colletotrichum truncatum]|uniref:Uncharacterized protein n=1 Tax=Colletotrichum truncatum TaxID=5467 RepID=A0ACC3YBR2_COLTU|nr:uncharacterized protein CTRU02_15550 [Colletotrichum truncatum]KAF6780929.1 hypothetical protein CTRU02_15550 [Colletotrichum truncatum]